MLENNLNQQNLDDEIDLKQLWRVIYRNKWRIMLLTLVVTVLATVFAYSKTPIYVASATMHIMPEDNKILQLEDVYGEMSASEEFYYTQLEIIQSYQVAERVAQNIDLPNHPLYKSLSFNNQDNEPSMLSQLLELLKDEPEQFVELSEEQKIDMQYAQAASYIFGNMSASPISKTQLVVISFQSENPDLAAIIANAIAQAYMDNHMEQNVKEIEKSAAWLNSSLQGLRAKLEESENKLQDFQEQESLVDVGGIKKLAAQEIEELSKDLIDATQQEQQIGLVYQLTRDKNVDAGDIENLPYVANHPSMKEIARQKRLIESKVQELGLTYGPKHPKMIAAKAELKSSQGSVNLVISRILRSVSNDYQNAQKNVLQIEQGLETAKARYQQLTRTEHRRRELKQDVETNEGLYQAFFNRLKETTQLEGFEKSIGRITDYASTPTHASKPRKKLIVVLAAMLSLMVGIGLTILLEAFNSRIRSIEDVENKIHASLLGIVPIAKTEKDDGKAGHYHYYQQEQHEFSEAIRTLRTSVQLVHIDKAPKVIAVTSTVPGEGKTLISTNLAFTLGQLEKTLLIDTDLRRPRLAKNFNMQQPGLSDLLTGNVEKEQCIYHDEKAHIDVLGAGTLPPNPQELLASNQFKALISELSETYDKIVIDTPPILAVSDAMIVARQADMLVFTVKANSTKEGQIKSAKKRMQQAGLTVDGVVLNQVDLEKAAEYQQFEGYYDQYGYSS